MATSPGGSTTGVESFLSAVLRSRLLQRGQLREALRTAPTAIRQDTEKLAEHFVKAGILSRFQVRKLLKGATRGLVVGPFQMIAPIGRGAMGTVFLARHSRNGQYVALKVLPPKKAREKERLLTRFRREMEMSERVAHAHLAWTHEVGVWQGVHYIAMEFIPGKSLYRTVAEKGPLPVPRAARLFAEVASALEHAHAQGLIHRDIKPSNIMITPNDHAKVLDLGLALIQGELPIDRTIIGGQGYVLGTMDYLSPEQAEDSSKVDPRSDIYSLGCVLYFALTGQPPFPGGTAKEKIACHRSEEPTPVAKLNRSVPSAFVEIVRKMMAKQPDQRQATAAELRQELLPLAKEERSLPMDKPEDPAYQEEIAAIKTGEWAEPTPEKSNLRTRKRRIWPRFPAFRAWAKVARASEPAPGFYTLFLRIGALVVATWVLVGLVYALTR